MRVLVVYRLIDEMTARPNTIPIIITGVEQFFLVWNSHVPRLRVVLSKKSKGMTMISGEKRLGIRNSLWRQPGLRCGWRCWLLLVLVICIASEGRGQSFKNRTNTDPIRRKVGVVWVNSPLRTRLLELAAQQGVGLFIDRRIDPDQLIDVELSDPIPLGRLLDHVANHIDSVPQPIGAVVYLAPAAFADRLPPRWQAIEDRCSQQLRAVARTRHDVTWKEGTTPKQILQLIGTIYGIRFGDFDRVPHDVWTGYQFSQLTVAEALAIVLTGFDLTVEFGQQGQALLVPVDDADVPAQRLIFNPNPKLTTSAISKRFDSIRWRRKDHWWLATGDHLALNTAAKYFRELDRKPAGEPDPNRMISEVFTLEVRDQPVGVILKTLEQQAGIKFDVSPDARAELETRVSFAVKREPIEGLLKAVLHPAGLRAVTKGNTIVINVVKPEPDKKPK